MTTTPSMERVRVGDGRNPRDEQTSFFLWRQDLALLRALYRGSPGGYSLHIRAAVHAMCNALRAELNKTEHGRNLLNRLGQDQLNA